MNNHSVERKVVRPSWERNYIFKTTKGRCWYCNILLTRPDLGRKTDYVVEHKIPISQGGLTHEKNLVPACRSCNSRKKGKTVKEYAEYLTRKNEHFNI